MSNYKSASLRIPLVFPGSRTALAYPDSGASGNMRSMTDSPEWITLAAYENVAGCPAPAAWVLAWLRERGIDWMPFREDEVLIDLAWGPDRVSGRWRGWFSIRVEAEALRRLGLHPEQPTSKIIGPSPPKWWHAAAERAAGLARRNR